MSDPIWVVAGTKLGSLVWVHQSQRVVSNWFWQVYSLQMCIHHPRRNTEYCWKTDEWSILWFSTVIPFLLWVQNTILKVINTQMVGALFCTWMSVLNAFKIRGNVTSTSSFGNPPRMQTGGQKDELSDFLSVAGYGNGACLLPVCSMAEVSGPPHFLIYIRCVGHIQVDAPSVVMSICFREFKWHSFTKMRKGCHLQLLINTHICQEGVSISLSEVLYCWFFSFEGINANFQCLPAVIDDLQLKSHQFCHIFQWTESLSRWPFIWIMDSLRG